MRYASRRNFFPRCIPNTSLAITPCACISIVSHEEGFIIEINFEECYWRPHMAIALEQENAHFSFCTSNLYQKYASLVLPRCHVHISEMRNITKRFHSSVRNVISVRKWYRLRYPRRPDTALMQVKLGSEHPRPFHTHL